MSSSNNTHPYTIKAPLSVTNSTTSTSKTTGASIITGGLGVSGPTFINSLNTDGASKINVMATADGSSGGPGLYMYDTSNNQFAIYCGSSGAGKSFSGGNAVAGVAGGTAQQIRIRTNNNALNGIVFENAAEQLLMGIGGDTGNTTIGGTLAIASTFTVGSASATTGKYLTILNDAGTLEFAVIKTATNFSTSSLTGDTVMKSLANRLLFQSGSGAAAMIVNTSNNVSILTTTASTTTGTGALTVAGGVGVAGAIYSSKNVISTNSDSIDFQIINTTAGATTSNRIITAFRPNIITGTDTSMVLGASLTTRNASVFGFYNDATSSALNYAGLNIFGGATAVAVYDTYTEVKGGPLKVTNTTASTSSTTGALVVSGGVGIAGVINAFGGAKLSIQNSVDGGSTRGIFMWDDSDPNWGIYMSTAGASKSLANGTAVAGGIAGAITGHALRFRSLGNADNGFIFENQTESLLVSISGGGNMHLAATTASTSTTTGALTVAGGLGVAGATYLNSLSTSGEAVFKGTSAISPTGNGVFLGLQSTFASIQLNNTDGGYIDFATSGTDYNGRIIYTHTGHLMEFQTNNVPRIFLDSTSLRVLQTTASTTTGTGALTVAGGLGVAGSTYLTGLRVQGGSKINVMATLDGSNGGNGLYMYDYTNTQFGIYCGSSGATKSFGGGTAVAGVGAGTAQQIRIRVNDNALNGILFENTSETILFGVNGSTGNAVISGNLAVTGSISKGSGTFDIQHPLSANENDRLVHSFIEGPRCDLIYRGSVALVSGSATVNLDSDCVESVGSAMTQGTFVALNKNAMTYLQNNESFDRVKGSISGNILTITCENASSTDTIVWMVVGERQDAFIGTWDRTDVGGSLITEYTRS
jgi:hypothetical protein